MQKNFDVNFDLLTFFVVLLLIFFLLSVMLMILYVHSRKLQRFQNGLERKKDEYEERTVQRLNREIHDNTGHHICLGIMGLRSIHFDPGDERSEKLKNAWISFSRAMDSIRDGVNRLEAHTLKNEGLEATIRATLEDFKKMTDLKVNFKVLAEGRYIHEAEKEKALYRILQESVRNIAQHAHAHSVDILLERSKNGTISLRISDDGIGVRPAWRDSFATGLHTGFENMRVRAEQLGGRFSVERAIPKGTLVKVDIPKR